MDPGAVRVSERTAAISPSTNTKPMMVASITATQPCTADIAAPLQPMENQAKRLEVRTFKLSLSEALGAELGRELLSLQEMILSHQQQLGYPAQACDLHKRARQRPQVSLPAQANR